MRDFIAQRKMFGDVDGQSKYPKRGIIHPGNWCLKIPFLPQLLLFNRYNFVNLMSSLLRLQIRIFCISNKIVDNLYNMLWHYFCATLYNASFFFLEYGIETTSLLYRWQFYFNLFYSFNFSKYCLEYYIAKT